MTELDTGNLLTYTHEAITLARNVLASPSSELPWRLTAIIDGVQVRTFWPSQKAAEVAYQCLLAEFAERVDEECSGEVERVWRGDAIANGWVIDAIGDGVPVITDVVDVHPVAT